MAIMRMPFEEFNVSISAIEYLISIYALRMIIGSLFLFFNVGH